MRYGIVLFLMLCTKIYAEVLYQNDFSAPSALDDFIIDKTGPSFDTSSVDIYSGQLRVQLDSLLSSGAYAAIHSSNFIGSYSSVLNQNSVLITWSLNVSNENGAGNNGFAIALASDSPHARHYTSTSYFLLGGGSTGDSMKLMRNGGDSTTIILDIPNGIGVLPDIGSLRITYNPSSSLWSVYGESGASPLNPTNVTSLLGSVVDDTYVGIDLPYFSLSGFTTGYDYFDNVTISTTPLPPPPLEPTIHSAVEIGWTSISGQTYQVQYSTNLVSINWIDLGESIIAEDIVTYVFDSTREASSRFYRVITE